VKPEFKPFSLYTPEELAALRQRQAEDRARMEAAAADQAAVRKARRSAAPVAQRPKCHGCARRMVPRFAYDSTASGRGENAERPDLVGWEGYGPFHSMRCALKWAMSQPGPRATEEAQGRVANALELARRARVKP
jgi:hypothetical protein